MSDTNYSRMMSCDPADPRRHDTSGVHGAKWTTGHCAVLHQAASGNHATGTTKDPPSLRKRLRIGTWNVRGFIRPGKLETVEKEMRRLGIDILGVSETHWRQSGHFESDSDNIIFCSGNGTSSRNGVGFMVPRRLSQSVAAYETKNDRIIRLKVEARPCALNLIQVYAPTSTSSDEELQEFYKDLNTVINNIPNNEITLLIGDMNAKVGRADLSTDISGAIGIYGLGQRNDRGETFVEFCIENQFTVMNTWFQQHPRRLYTWISPDGRTRNQIDYIAIQARWRSSILNVKTYPGADCGSDHQLLISEFRIHLKKTRKTVSKPNTKLNKPELQEFAEKIPQVIRNITSDPFDDAETTWCSFRDAVSQTAKEVRHRTQSPHLRKNWISDATWELIEKQRYQKEQGISSDENKTRYGELHAQVKKACRRDKNNYINNLCYDIEKHSELAQTGDLFQKIKTLTRDYKPKTWQIADASGHILTDLNKVLDRWRKYSEQLYRELPQYALSRSWDDFDLEPDILVSEVESAIKRLKPNAVGSDGICASLLKVIGPDGIRLLHLVCNKVWRTGYWPRDWTESLVIPLHKKGSTLKCDNYRTLSLISHVSKVMLCIINGRLARFVDWQIPMEQAGFMAGRGTREQIFNVRQIVERCREVNKPIVLCFIDYAKAFDCVRWRSMIDVLVEMGTPRHLAYLIESLYAESTARVRVEKTLSDSFKPERGVRQGCILSPKLFNIYGEFILRKATDGWNGGLSIGGKTISNLRYADDTTLIASSESEMAELFGRIETESRKLGLHINRSKTKLMFVDRDQFLTRSYELQDLECVIEFNYLGSIIRSDGDCNKEIIRRIQIAKGGMSRLAKVWRDRSIHQKTKVRLVRSLVFSIFLYGSETWTVKKNTSNRIDAFEMWCWRRLLRIPWTAFRTNQSILKELGIHTRLSTICRDRILYFFGHLARRGPDSLEKQIMTGKVEGKRARGRPPAGWADVIIKTTRRQLHESIHIAGDRARWRALVSTTRRDGHDPQT